MKKLERTEWKVREREAGRDTWREYYSTVIIMEEAEYDLLDLE